MAQSSIHINPAKVSYLAHNTRHTKTVNSIFADEPNYYSNTFKQAVTLYREELAKRSEAYTDRTGQKLQKKAVTLMSAVVNLNKHHTEKDLRKVVRHLEESLDTRVINYSIHRDEGHRDQDGNAVKNYHAHITFMGLDSEGASVRRKLTRSYLSKLQDKTAVLLGMERGTNYAKERKRRPKRLDTYEFKAAKEREERAVGEEIAKIKDITAENKRLRAALMQMGAKREHYAALEQEVRRLKEQAKSKDLTITQLRQSMEDTEKRLKSQIEALGSENKRLLEVIEGQSKEIDAKNAQIANMSQIIKGQVDEIAKLIGQINAATGKQSGEEEGEIVVPSLLHPTSSSNPKLKP